MNPTEVQQRYQHYQGVVEQWSASLYELDEHATYRLLAAGDMSGVTGQQTNEIVSSAPVLWSWLGLLRSRLEVVEELLVGTVFKKKASEIHALLIEKTITITHVSLPLGLAPSIGRNFVDSEGNPIDLDTNCEHLIELFRLVYNPVRDIVSEVDAVWRDLMPRIQAATTTLRRAQALSERLGTKVPQVRLATQRLEAVRASVSDDPLSLSDKVGPDLDQLVAAAAKAAGELEQSHGTLSDDLGNVDVLLAELRVLRARAAAAYSEAEAKVVTPTGLARVPSTSIIDGPNGLAHRARQFADLATDDAGWREARVVVDSWKAATTRLQQQLERALDTNLAPLDQRTDLRGLLRAYQVKASMISDLPIEVAELGQLAHDELYISPTDLGRAQELMDRYAAALGSRG